jgi:cold shock CspA family protein
MTTGTVIKWDPDRGFGFIKTEDNDSYFAHLNDFNPRVEPEPGDRVQFEIVMDDRKSKLRADKIRVI